MKRSSMRSVLAAVVALVGCGGEPTTALRTAPDAAVSDVVTVSANVAVADASGDRTTPSVDVPAGAVDPGRVTLHRLNRAEYNNTVRDLLGTAQRPADQFPVDDRGYGFDNIADVLSTSPVLVEMYLRAAEGLVAAALLDPASTYQRLTFEGEGLTSTVGASSGTAWNLWSVGDLNVEVDLRAAGRHRFTVRAWQDRAGPDAAQMSLVVDGAVASTVAVPNVAASPGEFSVEVMIPRAGRHRIAARFLNDYLDTADGGRADRNLYIDWMRLEGPLDALTATNPARARIMTCTPSATLDAPTCARQIWSRFGRRAWQRPLADDGASRLNRFLNVATSQLQGFDVGVGLGLQALLVAPQFLFRVELDADPTSPVAHPLTDHELAARLSYFLWSSTPDEALDALADRNALHDPATLRAQVTRMLADPKARALTENFAGQWLFTRAMTEHEVDPRAHPSFDAALARSFRAETEAMFEHMLRGDDPMDRMLTADFTFADDRLARHYGVALPAGTGARRVAVPAVRRAGVLAQGGVLMVNSHADRPSPTRRGQWIMNQILCAPTTPPPPGTPGLPMTATPTGTLRQQLEVHRQRPECIGCHEFMDPLGFGFEGFDAIGSPRALDLGFPVRTDGMLPDGRAFAGPEDLGRIVSQDAQYPRCVAQQLFTYALGRGVEGYDQGVLDAVTAQWRAEGMRLRDLIARLVLSDSFRTRRGEPAGGAR